MAQGATGADSHVRKGTAKLAPNITGEGHSVLVSHLLRFHLSVSLLAVAGLTQAAEPNPAPTQPTPVQAQPQAINSIAQAALKAGVQACAGRINQVSQFIIGDNPAGAFLFGAPAQPDQRLVAFSFEINPAKGPLAYASASFAPNQANGCGAEYEAIVYWPQSCDVVAAKQFAGAKKGQVLQKSIQVLEPQSAARIFLMPAGNGCVSIKKETVL